AGKVAAGSSGAEVIASASTDSSAQWSIVE
ncbi:outer membrane lipid asymmetry maintenance protein MlaD, partial [Acinetobacter baumannii]|nr:outer membrane lipid asymmetry maintenance protein MlaD [Acinetobacter baumannii]